MKKDEFENMLNNLFDSSELLLIKSIEVKIEFLNKISCLEFTRGWKTLANTHTRK